MNLVEKEASNHETGEDELFPVHGEAERVGRAKPGDKILLSDVAVLLPVH